MEEGTKLFDDFQLFCELGRTYIREADDFLKNKTAIVSFSTMEFN